MLKHTTRLALIAVAVTVLLAGGVVPTPAQDSAVKYVGADACLCHVDPVQKSWRETKHAKAFELLKLVGQEKNEKCLPCHTTGFGEGGYGSPKSTVNLEGVQCEACHGPASLHTTTADKTKIMRTPSVLVCARCHQDMNIHELQ